MDLLKLKLLDTHSEAALWSLVVLSQPKSAPSGSLASPSIAAIFLPTQRWIPCGLAHRPASAFCAWAPYVLCSGEVWLLTVGGSSEKLGL